MASRDPGRPNVLLVLTDDQGAWATGYAGNDEVVTPHLDALSAAGTTLDAFFCVSPVCSPARASLLTGRIPSSHGVHDWVAAGHAGAAGRDYLQGAQTFVDVLAADGYDCGLVGKWHLGASDAPRPGYGTWFAHERGGGPYHGAPFFRGTRREVVEGYLTDALTAEALAFVDRSAAGDDPFCLSLNYTAPHKPWAGQHPDRLTDLYRDCRFDSCPQEAPHPWLVRDPATGRAVAGEEDARSALVGYFAAVTGVDEGVGALVRALRQAGLERSTLVVFTSDNGFNCGHHGIWGKGNGTYPLNLYDTSIRVPAVVSLPGRVRAGRRTSELASAYDLAPTVLGLALGEDAARSFADGRPGRCLALEDPPGGTGGGAVVVCDEYGGARSIRSSTHKLVLRTGGQPDELYDLVADPGEVHNAVHEGQHAALVSAMAQDLRAWFAAYSSPSADGSALPVTGWGQYGLVGSAGAFDPPPGGAGR